MPSPLYIKFRSLNSIPYFYDTGTNEIFSLNEVGYAIIDDIGVLSDEEVIKKHSDLSAEEIKASLHDLREIQKDGIFQEHFSRTASQAKGVVYRNGIYNISDFLASHHLSLILEVTEQCNLRCVYCPYGDFYVSSRKHGGQSMSWETAKQAVDQFVQQAVEFSAKFPDNEYTISFYGGEALIETNLIREIVAYVKQKALETSLVFKFGITTNGTLLTDEIIHFLAENEFHVLISMDGPHNMHDRFRVFKSRDNDQEKKGSWEIVNRNANRFVELYPEYEFRGFAITITAYSNLSQLNDYLKEVMHSYPATQLNTLRRLSGHIKTQTHTCSRLCHCNKFNLLEQNITTENKETQEIIEQPDFLNYSNNFYDFFHKHIPEYLTGVANRSEEARKKFPLISLMVDNGIGFFHDRDVSEKPFPKTCVCPCLPGFSRIFCSVQGDYYPCERVDPDAAHRIGSIQCGVDSAAALNLIEQFRKMGDCGDCVAQRHCQNCFAMMYFPDDRSDENAWQGDYFQNECRRVIENMTNTLVYYTTIMETDSNALAILGQKNIGESTFDREGCKVSVFSVS